MSFIKIDNPVQSGFAMVPNVLWTWPGLGFKAKGFFAYLLSHRDGSCPPVARMEAETGLGRDARKAVMRELIAAGLCRWHIERDASGRVLGKWLMVTTRPLLAALAQAAASVDNSAVSVDNSAPRIRATENPSDGKSGAKRLKNREAATENPAITSKPRQKQAREAGAARSARSASPHDAAARASRRVEKTGTHAEGARAPSAPVPVSASAGAEKRASGAGWRKAAQAARLGLRWHNPETGEWHAAGSALPVHVAAQIGGAT